MCSQGPLRVLTVLIGVAFSLASVLGIGFSLFLLFGEPLGDYTSGTYTPNSEDVGPALLCSVISLVLNVILIGGTLQYSKGMLLAWLVWQVLLLIIFWLWYAYNQLKHYGYISWRGMRGCYFCGLRPHEHHVSSGGAIASFVIITCMIIVTFLHAIFKRRHRELTDPAYFLEHPGSLPRSDLGYSYQQQQQQQQQYPMSDYKYQQQLQQQQQYQQQQQQLQQQQLQQQYLQQQYLQQQQLLQQQQQQQHYQQQQHLLAYGQQH